MCSDCLNRLPFAPTDGLCRRCGRDASGLAGDFLCQDCRENAPLFDRAGSVLRFDGEARQMILHFKFERHLWLRDDLVDWLEAFARIRFNVDEIDLVLPMPSTLWHRLDRGYNQCEHLARALARRLGRPYSAWTLRRKGLFLRRQGGLDEAARRENARDSFAVRFPLAVRHRTLLVVDDVMTTGATLSECARSLKAAGAARVWCLTLARTWRA